MLAIWWRGGWVSIRVEERQLKVRNVWRRHRISWHDIDRFEPRLEFRLHRMGVVTTDGRRIPMAAITLHGDGTRGWGVDITERLRAHRDAVRAGRPAGDVPAGLPPIRSRRRRSDRQPTS